MNVPFNTKLLRNKVTKRQRYKAAVRNFGTLALRYFATLNLILGVPCPVKLREMIFITHTNYRVRKT
jgi:hypothetical protein